jgi:hypothetical protein
VNRATYTSKSTCKQLRKREAITHTRQIEAGRPGQPRSDVRSQSLLELKIWRNGIATQGELRKRADMRNPWA